MSKEALQERPAVVDEQGNIFRVRKIWDNGGKTIDRFTATFQVYNEKTGEWDIYTEGWNISAPKGSLLYKKIYCLAMNKMPFNPLGFGQSSTCVEGRHLGKRIAWSELPEECQKCVKQYMKA